VSSVSTVAQNRPTEIQACIQAFRSIDYADPRLYKSGLLRDAIEGHFWLIENSGKPLDSVAQAMKISIDVMMTKLTSNEKIYYEVSNYLFDLLEKHSLFQASEYLAIKLLNEKSCTVNSDKARQLESYRAMKKGNIASEIVFDTNCFANNTNTLKQVSDIKTPYTSIVFGASWCPKCKEELPEINKLYQKWKSSGIEVIFIALDEEKASFTSIANSFQFPSYSDLKKWDSKIVRDYFVFATPTIYLLNNKREILMKPNSVNQLDAWVDLNLQTK
jgi:thiol-disulfide isomerase/thioredoxin